MPGVDGLSAVPQARYQEDYERLGLLTAKAHEQPALPEDMYDGKGKVEAAEAWAGAVESVGGPDENFWASRPDVAIGVFSPMLLGTPLAGHRT